jgi:hypothetical protein
MTEEASQFDPQKALAALRRAAKKAQARQRATAKKKEALMPKLTNQTKNLRSFDPSSQEGETFFATVEKQAKACERSTRREIPELGAKLPLCYSRSASVLSLLEQICTCAVGCRDGDHMLERLVGRICSSAYASLDLARRGYYDESLALLRNAGEVASLLLVFVATPASLAEWSSFSYKDRWSKFSPTKVTKRLSNTQYASLFDEQVYQKISSRAIHPNPSTVPQRYNDIGVPTTGRYFQSGGLIICVNELARVLLATVLASSELFDLEKASKLDLLRSGRSLAEVWGGVTVEYEFNRVTPTDLLDMLKEVHKSI